MATANVTIGSVWELIALDTEDFYITGADRLVEVATSATEVAPEATSGHPVSATPIRECNRALIGPGFVYAKSRSGDVLVVLTTWTST
jgi:DNA topoisomerase VI subunit B